ncbi:MAG: hypothetical protein JZU67_04935 [Burkholderiaceae bacterium]|nr:hypothetical protein [Burkholderiaceae bacterium]
MASTRTQTMSVQDETPLKKQKLEASSASADDSSPDKVKIIEETSKRIAALEEKARAAADHERLVRGEECAYLDEIDPAVKCYKSAMFHLKNIVDYRGFKLDEKNEIAVKLRQVHDEIEAKYKAPAEIFEMKFRDKIRASNAATERKNAVETELKKALAAEVQVAVCGDEK